MSGYLRPVQPTHGRMSSWDAHQHRTTPSTEPGTDYYCPIGTPVVAPADGRVWMTGDSIGPATGRFVALAFDDGRGGRALHLSRRVVNFGDRVRRGQIIGYSGATGYGKEDWSGDPATGGAHVHWTLWPTQVMRFGYQWVNGKKIPYTIDHERFLGSTAGDGSSPFEEDDMSAEAERQINFIYKALAGPNNGDDATKELGWTDVSGNRRTVRYGALDILINNQALIAQLSGKVAELEKATAVDYGKLAAEIVKAGGTAPTVAQIAKAVNDDAARRMGG